MLEDFRAHVLKSAVSKDNYLFRLRLAQTTVKYFRDDIACLNGNYCYGQSSFDSIAL